MNELHHTDDYPPSSKAVAAEMTLLLVQEEEVTGICVICVYTSERRFELESDGIASDVSNEIKSLVENQLAETVAFETVASRETVAMWIDDNYPQIEGDGYTGGLHALACLSRLQGHKLPDGTIYTTQSHLIHN